tara:strand:+ start:204 stop:1025 length:822 start_codon:yes stop_codon:yes gene_type:complete
MKKSALVNIMGGFGNQVFQYCFANYLKQNGINVKVNTLWFKKNTKFPRNEIFPPSIYDCTKAGKVTLKKYELLNRYLNNEYIYSMFDDNNFIFPPKAIFNEFNGYWQDVEYINSSKDYLLNCLTNIDEINQSIMIEPDESSVMIHVRRTDYVEIGESLSVDYFEAAMNEMRSKIKEPKFTVFTDDESWVKQNKIFQKINKIYSPSDAYDDTVKTFSRMLHNKHYILSNSTFSLVAAFLKTDESSITILPDPWMRKKNKNFELLFKNPIKINNI